MMRLLLIALVAVPFAAHAQMQPLILDNSPGAVSCTATCTTAVLTTNGYTQVNLEASGTGTVLAFTVEGKQANGTAWHTLPAVVPTTPGTFVTSMSANGYWSIPCAGYAQVRVNLSAITAGTETFALEASVRRNIGIGQ